MRTGGGFYIKMIADLLSGEYSFYEFILYSNLYPPVSLENKGF